MSKKKDWVTNNDQFIEKINNIKPDYTPLEEWSGSQHKILFKHNLCNKTFLATPNNMLKVNYGGCSYCAHLSRVNTKRKAGLGMNGIQKILDDLYPDCEYKLVDGQEYVNNKVNYKFIHSKCNNICEISPVNLRAGKGCKWCNKINREKSKGVKLIEAWLDENNINYETEYRFSDCKNERELPFDFIIFNEDDTILLEFDGEHHFTTFYKDRKEIIDTQYRDNLKNQYCLDNNYKLIRISYKARSNINSILYDLLVESSTTIESDYNNILLIKENKILKQGIYNNQQLEYTQASGSEDRP